MVCLTETHVTPDISNSEIFIENYNLIRCDSTSKHTGGVVIYYVKSNIKNKILNNYHLEMCLWYVTLNIVVNQRNFTITVNYRSRNLSTMNYLIKLQELIGQDLNPSKNVICFGDYNINMLDNTDT